MGGSTFDLVTRLVGAGGSRRGALRSTLGGATLAASSLLVAGNAGAKKKRKKCKKKTCQPTSGVGETCETNLDCCANETNYACALADGAISILTCCGVSGASCEGSSDCCEFFVCFEGVCVLD